MLDDRIAVLLWDKCTQETEGIKCTQETEGIYLQIALHIFKNTSSFVTLTDWLNYIHL